MLDSVQINFKKGPRNLHFVHVYRLCGNVLLFQRLYICANGRVKQKYFSGSLSILEDMPKLYGLSCFLIAMFQQIALRKAISGLCGNQTLQGIHFLAIGEGISFLYFKEFSERRECYSLTHDSNTLINSNQHLCQPNLRISRRQETVGNISSKFCPQTA